ncbi:MULTISPECIES: hypothetical protein [Brevibacillus]|jgi:hypothetical protein|uniref:Uncharacterized protein n=1 Tax=Brevibacillus centrosporus TaxID=54910 RepID=A0A1I3YI85_9BACL|nr:MULTISPECIES: hypothetical protein [Brevibacillus]MDR7315811.1 hypothetical protein [Brevibacillus nitrificans]MEC2127534.1 hypothetical protein [Brevibacillus centrosporus]MED4910519.1 hypothetical protein [Brevibacillus centrosporus]SFK31588.1 hypothetical protein SAMN05518846_111155 [Brevibacillus centrosporus]
MVSYFLLAAAFVLLAVRFTKLLRLKRRNLSAREIDQHLHALLNEKRERP